MAQYRNLFEAIKNGDDKYFCSLLECITWPRTTDYLDFELLIEALKYGRKSIVNHLLDQECCVTIPASKIHAIHLALAYRDFSDIIKRLLALGARVSDKDAKGDTAVHVAFFNNAPERIIDMLLLSYLGETKENAQNADGLSVLHIACTRPNLFIMQKLIENYVDEKFFSDHLNDQVDLLCNCTYAGYTPLHFAVSRGHKEIMKFLVMQCHVDILKQDADGSTPLHLALERRNVHAVDLMMAYNFPEIANEDYVNSSGLSHFMAACIGNIQEFAVKFMETANLRSTKSLKTLIDRQVNIGEGDDQSLYAGYSPIHFAAEFGRINTIQQLVFFGSSFFTKEARMFSPLVLALKHGHDDIAWLLFWCYRQYRRMIYTDERTDSNAQSSEGSVESERWHLCNTHFNVLDA